MHVICHHDVFVHNMWWWWCDEESVWCKRYCSLPPTSCELVAYEGTASGMQESFQQDDGGRAPGYSSIFDSSFNSGQIYKAWCVHPIHRMVLLLQFGKEKCLNSFGSSSCEWKARQPISIKPLCAHQISMICFIKPNSIGGISAQSKYFIQSPFKDSAPFSTTLPTTFCAAQSFPAVSRTQASLRSTRRKVLW